ncbi:MAG: glycosyltransferase family 9 protein [bacterium]|nr:glycosyltransferase family 9 protein [Candidatus Kapabacteria bacterium]
MTDNAIDTGTIGIVQLGPLGDTILTTPLFIALRELYPDARLTLIASSAAATIGRYQKCIDDVFEVSHGVVGLLGAMVRMRMRSFDLYIDPKDHRSSTSRLLMNVARATRVIAHSANLSSTLSGSSMVNVLTGSGGAGHFVDRMLAPVHVLAPEYVANRRPRLDIPSTALVEAARIRQLIGDGYAVLNVSAGSESRYWRVDRFVAIAQWLPQQLHVVLLSAPKDRAMANEIASVRERSVVAHTRDILEVAAIVEHASIVVTTDTSVVHVASAFNTPTVALYPNDRDNLQLFSPLASHHRAIRAPDGGGVADISVRDVQAAIEIILA